MQRTTVLMTIDSTLDRFYTMSSGIGSLLTLMHWLKNIANQVKRMLSDNL